MAIEDIRARLARLTPDILDGWYLYQGGWWPYEVNVFIEEAPADVALLLAEVDRLTRERDAARTLAARLRDAIYSAEVTLGLDAEFVKGRIEAETTQKETFPHDVVGYFSEIRKRLVEASGIDAEIIIRDAVNAALRAVMTLTCSHDA